MYCHFIIKLDNASPWGDYVMDFSTKKGGSYHFFTGPYRLWSSVILSLVRNTFAGAKRIVAWSYSPPSGAEVKNA